MAMEIISFPAFASARRFSPCAANATAKFLAQVDFLTPMIFRISVAAELAPRAFTRRSDSIAIPRLSACRLTSGYPQCSSSIG